MVPAKHLLYNQLDDEFENYSEKIRGLSTQIKFLRLIKWYQGPYNVSKLIRVSKIIIFPSYVSKLSITEITDHLNKTALVSKVRSFS